MKTDPPRGEFFALNNWKYDSLALKDFLEKLVYNHWVAGEDKNGDPLYKLYLNMEFADGTFKGLVVCTDKLFKNKVEEMLSAHRTLGTPEITRRLIAEDSNAQLDRAAPAIRERHLTSVKTVVDKAVEDPKSNVVGFADGREGYYANEVICMQVHDGYLYVGTIDGLFVLKAGMLEPVEVRV